MVRILGARGLMGVLAAGALLAGTVGMGGTASAVPHPSKQQARQAEQRVSADCSVHSDGRLYCGNKYHATAYWNPRYNADNDGTLETTYSWFSCWQHGQQHSGGNDIWYWTQVDNKVNHDGWGFVPAVDVFTPTGTDPAPGLAQCPFS